MGVIISSVEDIAATSALFYYASAGREGGIIKWTAVSSDCPSVRLSVRPSVCPVPQHNSRTERPRKPKFGRMKDHHTSIA